MPFTPTDFQDSPSTATPITAAELDKLGTQYAQALADVPTASTTVSGKVELATSAEAITGSDATRAVTPSALAAKFADASVAELIRDTMGVALVAGTNVTITVNDAGDTITIAASGGGGGGSEGYTAPIGGYIPFVRNVANSAGLAGVIGTEYAYPLLAPAGGITLDQIATAVWTGQTALVGRVGVYADVNGLPSTTVLHDLGTIDLTASGVRVTTLGAPQVVAEGLVWISIAQQVGATPAQFRTAQMPLTTLSVATAFTSVGLYASRTGSTGALAGNATAWTIVDGSWNGNCPLVSARRSA